MSNRIFEYYREELRYLYETGREFSQAHSDAAGLLDFEKGAEEDPFVRRLVEAFAFLTARVQMKLDDDFPQIADAMLEKILPLATRPFPAFSVAEFHPGDQLKPGGELLPRHKTRILLDGQSEIQLRTCYDMSCQAVEIVNCELKREFPEARHAMARQAISALKVSLVGEEDLPLNAALGKTLRFFVADPDTRHELIALLFNSVSLQGVGFQQDQEVWSLPADQLRVLGFAEEELVLPAFKGLPLEYQMLMELFAYPDKHAFFELPIPEALRESTASGFDLYFYFNTSNERLEGTVNPRSLLLNCCPVVNLFEPQTLASPISKYCVDTLIDANYSSTDIEIFDLGQVSGIGEDGKQHNIEPFYSVEHHGPVSNSLFHYTRRKARTSEDGSDIFLSLVDLAMQPSEENKFRQVTVDPICCNRRFRQLNLLPTNSSGFKVVTNGLVKSATRVADWQRMRMPSSDSHFYWELISLLNLNFLLLTETRKVETLRRMLELLDRPDTPLTRSWINSVATISTERIIDRIDARPWPAIVDGTRIEIGLDESRNSNRPGSWYTFACGLNHFLSLHTGINSFTELTITAAEDGQILTRFSKRCGTRKLL